MLDFSQLEKAFRVDVEAQGASLREYEKSVEYFHGKQLSDEFLSVIAGRGSMPIVENIFKLIVNKILGYKIQSVQEIKVSGRQESDKALAHLLNDLTKVFSQSRDYERSIFKKDFELMMGCAVLELWIEKDEDYQIRLNCVPTKSFFIDKHSSDSNALDARRFHKVLNMEEQEAKRLFPNVQFDIVEEDCENRVRLVESWIKEYEKDGYCWNRYIWDKDKIIKKEKKPFLNNTHPFVVGKFKIDHKNQWYGLFRDLQPICDYINLAENRMSNMMGSIKAFFEIDSVLNPEEFARNASLDNAVVAVESGAISQGKIQFVQHSANIQALSAKVAEKRNIAKVLSGLNDEALGLANGRNSGVAIAQRRDAGLMGLQDYLSVSDAMEKLLFSKVIDFIQYYFTKEQVFKIVDEKVGERYFSINTDKESEIRVGKFDLIYKTTPKISGREERFTQWSEILKTISSARPELIASLLPLMLKDVDSPIVAEIEEAIAKAEEQQAQAQAAQAPLQQQAQMLELESLKAKVAETQGKARKYDAQGALAEQVATKQLQELQSAQGSTPIDEGNPSANKVLQTNKGMDLR